MTALSASEALPLVLSGCDVVGIAQTGSGKTLATCLHLQTLPTCLAFCQGLAKREAEFATLSVYIVIVDS